MLADRRVWRGALPALPDAVCLELPSHGRAPAWDGDDYQTQALGLLDAQTRAPVHLVGHSFGATVALRFAVEHPERLASLTLIEPVFFFAAAAAPLRAYADRAAPVMDAIAAGELHSAAELFLDAWGVPNGWAALPAPARDAIAAQMPLIAASAPSIVEDSGGIWPRLGRGRGPIKLITGSRSEPVMAAIAEGLAGAMPLDAHVIDGAGHMIPLTHADALVPLLPTSP